MGAKKKIPKGLDIEELVERLENDAAAEIKAKKATKTKVQSKAELKSEEEEKVENIEETKRETFIKRIKDNQENEEIKQSIEKKTEMREIRVKNTIAEENRRGIYAATIQKKLKEQEER